jgi:uncharacterized lipoprotein NlpE involved in copper resistance
MKYLLLILIITLVGCNNNEREEDFFLCNEDSKILMNEFALACLDKGKPFINIPVVDQYGKSVSTPYHAVVKSCSYAAKRMFCMEPLQNKKESED